MSLGDEPRTTVREVLSPNDPHALLDRTDYAELSGAGATARTELGHEVLTQADKKLEAFQRVQQGELIKAAEAEGITGTTEEVITRVNRLQIGNNADRALYIKINNEMIRTSAAALEEQGLDGATLGTIIQRKISAAGTTVAGIGTDLTNISTTGLVTIAAASGIPYLMGGGKWWVGGLTTLAVAMQSPNATRAVTETVAGGLRGVRSFAAGHIATGFRGMDILNTVGTGEPMDQVLYQHGQGFVKDLIAPIGYAFDKNYDPNAPGANAAAQEYYHLGADLMPEAFKPFLGTGEHFQTTREQTPQTLATLPTPAEGLAAGRMLKQVEGLVNRADFDLVQAKRINGEAITPEENRKYILFKYCDLMHTHYVGPNAFPLQAELVRAGYNNATGTADIDAIMPLTGDLADPKLLELPESQREDAIRRAEAWASTLSFEQLTKYGFVGLAGGAILTLMLAGMTFGVVKSALGIGKSPEEKEASRYRISDEENLNRAWYNVTGSHSGRYRKLTSSAESGTNGDIKGVYDDLVKFGVLFGNDDLAKLLKDNSQALDIKNSPHFKDFLSLIKPPSEASRQAIRDSFLNALKAQPTVPALHNLAEAAAQRNALHARVRKLYRFARQGSGSEGFTLNIKGGSPVQFSINRENDVNERLHNIAGFATARAARDFVPPTNGYAFRYASGGPTIDGNNNTAKAVKLVINSDGTVTAQYRVDRALNANPANWRWQDLGEVESIA